MQLDATTGARAVPVRSAPFGTGSYGIYNAILHFPAAGRDGPRSAGDGGVRLRPPNMSETPLPRFLTVHADGVTLSLKVQPRASRNEIGPAAGEVLRIKVTSPPVDSAANEAVIELLAEWLDCRRADVRLLRGQTSRLKVVKILGVSASHVLNKL